VQRYPKVRLTIKQGSPDTLAQMVLSGNADFAIATETSEESGELRKLSCETWTYAAIVPDGHPLLDCRHPLTIEDLAAFPLVTYEFALNHNNNIARAFQKARLDLPAVALSSADTDVLKTYVRLGLGVGLMAKMAYDGKTDGDLHLIDASHLFEPSHTY
ncbi:HTH-type transcriptional regulator CysB, partial [Bacillus stratosphericus]